MWSLMRRNPGALGAALLLHLMLAVLTLVGVDWLASPEKALTRPRVVQATIVDAAALESEAKRQAEAEIRRRVEAMRQAAAKAHRRAEAKRQAEAEAHRRAEAKRQAEAEAHRRAEAKRQVEAKAQRRAEAEAHRRAEVEAELLAALDAELAASELGIYKSAIQERIRRIWVRQPGMGQNLSCLVEARIIPGGEVVPASVHIIRGSGNPAFDHSVVTAVYKASPLPVPAGQPFEQFRNLRLEFRP